MEFIQSTNSGINGLRDEVLSKLTKNIYNIKNTEQFLNCLRIDLSEGIGSPLEAAFSFIRLKEKYKETNWAGIEINPNLLSSDH